MALAVGRTRRGRSSTGASRSLNKDEEATETASLIEGLSALANRDGLDESAISEACQAAEVLRKTLREDAPCKDIFRRGKGFDACLHLLRTLAKIGSSDAPNTYQIFRPIILLLSDGIHDHRGNEKYFSGHLSGWTVLERDLISCLRFLPGESGQGDSGAKKAIDSIMNALLQWGFGNRWTSQRRGSQVYEAGDGTTKQQDVLSPDAFERAEAVAIAIRFALRYPGFAFGKGLLAIRLATVTVSTDQRSKVKLWQTGILSDLLWSRYETARDGDLHNSLDDLIATLVDLGLPSLDDVTMLFQKSCDADEARTLLLQLSQKSKDPAFVQFDLALCGFSSIELPSLPRAFPPSTGYSLSAWMRIDTFDSSCHTTLFGAFDSSQKCFLLLYLEKDSHQLILQTSIRSSRPSVRFKATRFASNRWYHVALVHRRSSADPKQSSAVLFIDGEFAEQVKCAYPEAPPEQERKQSASSPSGPPGAPQRHNKPVQAFFGTPHDLGLKFGRNEVMSKWSLASAHLFQAPLTDEFIAVCHRLGPRYSGNMQDCLGPLLTYRASAELNRYNELLHPDKSDKSDIVTATESRGSDVLPESRLLISICPTAIINFDGPNSSHQSIKQELDRKAYQRYMLLSQTSKAVAINAAIPTVNEAISRSYGTGILTGDPVVAVRKALDDATWCLTGSLPILARLLAAARTKHAFLQSVQIFFECVKDNWRISEAMEKGDGFGVLAALIREKLGFESGAPASSSRKASTMLSLEERQAIPAELLQMVLDFVGYDNAKPENSMIVNPMAYRVLLVDFDTWRRCNVETQRLYYSQFVHFVSHNKHQSFNQKRLVRMRVVRRLIEALKFEDFQPETVPSMMEAIKALLDHNSAANMYRELAVFIAYGLQDERALAARPPKSMASIVNLRQKAGTWARSARSSRPSTPGTPGGSRAGPTGVPKAELAINVLQMLDDILCGESSTTPMRRFNRAVPNRWLLHLLAESDVRVINLTIKIFCRSLAAVGAEFKSVFIEKNGGFITLRNRLKVFWRSPELWVSCFAIFFGISPPLSEAAENFTVFKLVSTFCSEKDLDVAHPEILPTLMAMLETGLRYAIKLEQPDEAEIKILKTVIQFLSELYTRSASFRVFAATSRYIQEILFVLYPVLVGSDRLSADMELQADKDSLSFKGEEVKMRPHSNSLGERPPSVRSLTIDDDKAGERRTPSPRAPLRVDAPRRLSSFVLVSSEPGQRTASPAQFNPVMSPKKTEAPKLNVGNAIVESLLEVAVSLFIDLVCNKDKFNGIGLFLKVPPGFREHQAYFESYVLVHTLTQLWHHLQLNQALFVETRVLTNLSRYCQHMAEAVFEGWFIDGAQPLLDFTGKVLEYLQQEDVASSKGVRLCSQHVNSIRLVFLRVCLWRLAELDESANEAEATAFLNKMDYWQTILFSSENQETLFVRLICYLLYMKLVSNVQSVRLAAARLWRTILVQKPTESATLLTYAMGSEQRHLSTGFMKLVSVDDEDFIAWIDENRPGLDNVFIDALNKPWNDFVSDENRRTEESAKNRLSKRREKLRQWQTEENAIDDFMHRYEISTTHWRSNVHAQERLKLQRSIQDHQENVNHLLSVFAGLEKQVRQPCGIDPAKETPKWQLDETESINRMRMRTVPDASEESQAFQPKRKMSERKSNGLLKVDTQVSREVSDNIMSSVPGSPLPGAGDGATEIPPSEQNRSRGDSMSGSQLLEGAFEMVDDPREADDGMIEDKNRKVMTSLQRGDVVQQLHNISRIVGLEACEGLLVVGKKCLYLQDNYFQRSDGEIVSVSQAPDDERDPYVQLISGKDVGSQRTKHSIGDQETRHWTWSEVLSISKRRFLFRDVSIEVFFTDGRSYLLTCMTSKIRDDLYNAVVQRAPHVHSSSALASEDAWRLDTLRNPEEGPQTLGSKFASVFNSLPSHAATKKWSRGDMSNFQYLMLINTMAGRTFNDLTQYPIFPWVIADYTSEELDLDNQKSFRDLSKPMGCQTEGREAEFRDRYRQFAEMGDHNAPPFHYGTHYSSAMIVSSYLIRLQPFVQSYLLLQGGSFDHADRLFDSIEKAWLSSSRENMTDVRELTPEFFYLPEFLVNTNKYDFGAKQGNGELVNDVKLPRWAKGDPQIFVQKHREALESPYVSANLHQWIDLVFGFKQRGEAAVEATNVFQHLSYQGAKDLDTIDDPVERLASIGIIHSFGQTPHQVFQKPHPFRERDRPAIQRLDALAESLIKLPDPLFASDEKVTNLTFSSTQERLLCAGPAKLNILPSCDRYVQWGFADHSLRFYSSNTKRLLGLYENTHIGPITTATFADSKTLVTASTDCTIALWNVVVSRESIEIQPKTYLFGHRSAVTLVTASRVFSTLLSASEDGQVLIWGLNRQQCIRILHPPGSARVQTARISNVSGHIAICQGSEILLYTLNGHLLLRQTIASTLADQPLTVAFYEGEANEFLSRTLLLTGHGNGVANIWALTTTSAEGKWCLKLVKRLQHGESGINALLPMPQAVYTGDEGGRVWEWDCVVRAGSTAGGGGGRGR